MLRAIGCIAAAISALFIVCTPSGSERVDRNAPSAPSGPSAPLRFVEGGLPLPEIQNPGLGIGVGGDPRVWASMLTELQSSGSHL
jgi:hypothetical protein